VSGALLAGVLLTGCGGVSPGPLAGPEPDSTGSESDSTGSGAPTAGSGAQTTGSEPGGTGSGPQTGGTQPQTGGAGPQTGGSGAQPTGSGPQTTALPDGTGETTGPEIETSGTESTGPTETGQAVDTPRLPIGGDTEFTDAAEQCAHASFLGQGDDSIPTGVSIVVTGPVFSQGLFAVGGSACDDLAPGEPACLDGFVFTAEDTGPCMVPVQTAVTLPPDQTEEPPDQLRLSGRLQCPAGQEAGCHDLAQRLDRDDQFIELFPPVAESPGTTTTGSTGTTTESTETTTESTETTTETETSESETTPSGAGN
jgi:hypothetical protein